MLAYAAVTGAAWLIAPDGEVALSSGASLDVDVARIARIVAARVRGTSEVLSLRHEGMCIVAAGTPFGWTLCVVSTIATASTVIGDRVQRARHVLELAFADSPHGGTPSSGEGGASALISVEDGKRPRKG